MRGDRHLGLGVVLLIVRREIERDEAQTGWERVNVVFMGRGGGAFCGRREGGGR